MHQAFCRSVLCKDSNDFFNSISKLGLFVACQGVG